MTTLIAKSSEVLDPKRAERYSTHVQSLRILYHKEPVKVDLMIHNFGLLGDYISKCSTEKLVKDKLITIGVQKLLMHWFGMFAPTDGEIESVYVGSISMFSRVLSKPKFKVFDRFDLLIACFLVYIKMGDDNDYVTSRLLPIDDEMLSILNNIELILIVDQWREL